MHIEFKTDEPKAHDSGDAMPNNSDQAMNVVFNKKCWVLHSDYLNATKNKMDDLWKWFNMNIDLSKNLCEKHKFYLEVPETTRQGSPTEHSRNHKREIVIKN